MGQVFRLFLRLTTTWRGECGNKTEIGISPAGLHWPQQMIFENTQILPLDPQYFAQSVMTSRELTDFMSFLLASCVLT
jgi:hypothetical protein